jgi:hypothetical protein
MPTINVDTDPLGTLADENYQVTTDQQAARHEIQERDTVRVLAHFSVTQQVTETRRIVTMTTTAEIAANIVMDWSVVTPVNYTIAGDTTITIGNNATEFTNGYRQRFQIEIGGVIANPADLTWNSPTSFRYNDILYTGTLITVLSFEKP